MGNPGSGDASLTGGRDSPDALVKREERYFLPPYRVMVFESRLKFFGR